MSVRAYQAAAARAENPRETELRVFALATQKLVDAEKLTHLEFAKIAEALDMNRRLWSTLAIDCASEGNKLPEGIRASIISLSMWVSKYSSDVIRDHAPIEPLIDVNRNIMAGLSGKG